MWKIFLKAKAKKHLNLQEDSILVKIYSAQS